MGKNSKGDLIPGEVRLKMDLPHLLYIHQDAYLKKENQEINIDKDIEKLELVCTVARYIVQPLRKMV